MTIWALSDLHLPFGNPSKNMEVFGPTWENYTEKIASNWLEVVDSDDLVLIAGDISWARKLEEAYADLDWIEALPGEKLLIRGNHDSWWPSSSRLQGSLPPSMHAIDNSAFNWNGITFGGARLWDTHEYDFTEHIKLIENPFSKTPPRDPQKVDPQRDEKIFLRELNRLKISLEKMDKKAETKIALTHYPPIGTKLKPSRASAMLEDFGVHTCVFGHLHSIKKGGLSFGEARGVSYVFTSADALGFTPIKIFN